MTRLLSIGAAVLAGVASSAQAADRPATQPAKPVVLVLPFSTPTESGASWVGRAAKDDVVAGLTRGLDARVRTPSTNREAADATAALEIAHQYHANYVIYGYAQEADTIARITGQVLDVETGLPIGALKVTGPATRILDIDDALTAQALTSLPQSMLKPEAMASLQRPMQDSGPDVDSASSDGLAMISQSYPVGSTTFIQPLLDFAPTPQIQNISYIYSPTIVVSAGYGYGGSFAPSYYGPGFGYPAPAFNTPHHHAHLPVILHGPQRPDAPRGTGGSQGVVIGGNDGGGSGGSTPVTFGWSQNPGSVSTPFMGGGQSFPVQNGFTSVGAGAGFSVFTGPRFSNTPNLSRGYYGSRGSAGGR